MIWEFHLVIDFEFKKLPCLCVFSQRQGFLLLESGDFMSLFLLQDEKQNLFQTDAKALICFGCSPYFLEDYGYDCIFYGKYFLIFKKEDTTYSGGMNEGLIQHENLLNFPDYRDFQYVICTDADDIKSASEENPATLFEYLAEAFFCARDLNLQKLVITFPFLTPQLCDVTQESALQEVRKMLHYFQQKKSYQPDVYFTRLYQDKHDLMGDFSRNRRKTRHWIYRGLRNQQYNSKTLSEKALVPEILIQNLLQQKDILVDFHSMVAIAAVLEFSQEERFEFLHDAGYFYPTTREDFIIEYYLNNFQQSIPILDLILKYYNPAWGFNDASSYTEKCWKELAKIYLASLSGGDFEKRIQKEMQNLLNIVEQHTEEVKINSQKIAENVILLNQSFDELLVHTGDQIDLVEASHQELKKAYEYNREMIEELEKAYERTLEKQKELEKKYELLKPEWGRFVDYLKKYRAEGNSYSKLAKEITLAKSRISVFVNSEKHVTMTKDTAIAIAVGIKLPQGKRIDCIRCAGHSYPVSERDFQIEELLQGGIKTVGDLNDALDDINPDWILTGTRTLVSKKDKEEDATNISYRI